MKLLVAIIFSMIAFVSSASKNSGICVKKAEVNSVQISKGAHANFLISNHETQKEQTSQKNSSDCQICHLGHCDFMLTAKFNFAITTAAIALYSSATSFNIYDFHSGLFRPPIA